MACCLAGFLGCSVTGEEPSEADDDTPGVAGRPSGSGGAGAGLGAGGTLPVAGRGGQAGSSSSAGRPSGTGGGGQAGGAAGAGGQSQGGGGSSAAGQSQGGSASSTGGQSQGGAQSSGGQSPGPSGGSSGVAPTLPEISGMCPQFVTGTATIGGLSGISMQAGAKKDGTGSLIFYWHGTGSSAGEVNVFMPAAVRKEVLDAGGVIVSFGRSTGTGGDCSGTSTFSKDDFKIADLIAACAVRDHGIDPRRIYATGCSAGGLQAGCMGALRSSYIAAVVPNSGGEVFRQTIQDPKNTPAVMTMHGGASDVVVVAFSTTSATLDAHMKGAGSFVINCNHGGGHCAAPAALYTAGWDFMKAHPFGVEPSPYSSALPESYPDYCKTY